MIKEKDIELYKLSNLINLKAKEFHMLYQKLYEKVVEQNNSNQTDMQKLLEDLRQNNLEIKDLSERLSKLIG